MASKRHLRRRSCENKMRHPTMWQAMLTLKKLRAKDGFISVSAYGCSRCKGFHLGHPPQRVRQAIAARRGEL